jgi:N-acetylglucosaminyldiphosphoundecaprenol N-acetyl-beta-D-mannosaminyltransferase
VTHLLGLDFADLTADLAATHILARPPDAPFGYVVTPNADHLVRLARAPALAAAYRAAWLRLLDSRVVARAARMLRLPAPTVCPGSDLTARILARIPRGTPVIVIGASVTTLARLGLSHAAHYDPPFGFIHDTAAIDMAVRFVLAHPSRLVFFAVGSPRQELLALAVRASRRATGTGLCIGASLAFASGETARAPAWMQTAGLEWAHRLACEPRRLSRRYLLDSPKVFQLLWRARAG